MGHRNRHLLILISTLTVIYYILLLYDYVVIYKYENIFDCHIRTSFISIYQKVYSNKTKASHLRLNLTFLLAFPSLHLPYFIFIQHNENISIPHTHQRVVYRDIHFISPQCWHPTFSETGIPL